MSLLRCTLRLERIGDILTPFGHQLKDVERRCLVSLSQAARQAGKGQIALNAITEAQKLDPLPIFDVSEEFANVLWLQNEHRAAVDYLRNLAVNSQPSEWDPDKVLCHSLILSRLVCSLLFFHVILPILTRTGHMVC
jgi:ataxia telangiectasia mutated family protein